MKILTIKRRADFVNIQQNYDSKFVSNCLVVLCKKTEKKYRKITAKNRAKDFVRLGYTVTKKIDKRAVVRNRVKRLLREANAELIKNCSSLYINNYDYEFIAKKNILGYTYDKLLKEIKFSIKNIKNEVIMNKENFLDVILNFMKEAGEIALNYQNNLSANIKKDETIVTEADLTISRLFHKKLDGFVKNNGHKILDEENLPEVKTLFGENTEYLWTIDPIDGTTTYYHGFPLWAVAVSLYKNLKPYISCIYMPKMQELIYTDGEKTYFVKNAFCKDEIKTILETKPAVLTKKSVILEHKLQNFDRLKYTVLDLYSSYVLAFYTLTGRSVGCFFNRPMKLWDITATLPLAKNLGLVFKNIETQEELNELNVNLVDENWYIRDTFLMCNKENYKEIINIKNQ